jgi:hypothetical protein
MEKTTSSFAPLRNAQGMAEVMEFLASDNMAAIVEALRSEKWAQQLFPLYVDHKNHVVRYEIACSQFASKEELVRLCKDQETIVRQAACQNLMERGKSKVAVTQGPQSEVASVTKEDGNKETKKEKKKNREKIKKQKTKGQNK